MYLDIADRWVVRLLVKAPRSNILGEENILFRAGPISALQVRAPELNVHPLMTSAFALGGEVLLPLNPPGSRAPLIPYHVTSSEAGIRGRASDADQIHLACSNLEEARESGGVRRRSD